MLEKAIEEARKTMNKNMGGPFGALITNKDGKIISIASNTVLYDHDPTAHAEINAIRIASKKLNTHDLSDCILYTTAYPCPMCMSAIIWANIKEVYFACTKEDAGNIGFRDDVIYEYLKGNKKDLIKLNQLDREECIKLFNEYKNQNKTIY